MYVHMVPVSSLSEAVRAATDASLEGTAQQASTFQAAEPPAPRVVAVDEEPTRMLAPDSEEGGVEEYLPRNRLSVVPQVLTNVDVQFPTEVSGIVDLRVRITLFVDEKGTVRRVRFDSAAIPSSFAAAVLDTFLKARFKPGEVDGVAARSQIRLQVEFHANRGT
jgi:hypothetical protein